MRVLLVEDSLTQLECLAEIMRAHGFDVVTAMTGAEALARRVLLRPNVILLDLILPDVAGERLLEVMRETSAREGLRRLPVMVLSGADEKTINSILARQQDLGPVAALRKPYETQDVINYLRGLEESPCSG